VRTTIFAIAAGIIAATASAASAMPAAQAGHAGEAVRGYSSTAVEHVDYKDRRRMMHKRDRHMGNRHRHWDDNRYSQYRGWHRYGSRPLGWRNRGCVAVGPIWFCP
jgi:hypothetical protein